MGLALYEGAKAPSYAAIEAASKSTLQLELINGARLGELLIQYNVGVRTKELVKADLDETFFEELDY